MLHVFGWEPVRCYDTFAMGWGKVADMAVANSQLIGAAYNSTNVSVHVVDLSVSSIECYFRGKECTAVDAKKISLNLKKKKKLTYIYPKTQAKEEGLCCI